MISASTARHPGTGGTVAVPVGLLHSLLIAAMVDSKTGLLNVAAWRSRVVEVVTTSTCDEPLWGLLLVDLDRFGYLNEAHGYAAADQVLAAVAHSLRDAAGSHAIVGRFGGDEFLVLVPVQTLRGLRRAAESVRLAVASVDVAVASRAGRARISDVTASVGRALHDPTARLPYNELGEMWWAADSALWAAKRAGGNESRIAPGWG